MGEGTQGDLEAAAGAMFMAVVTGANETYFDFLSQACRDRLGFAAVAAHLDGRRYFAEGAGIDVLSLGVDSVAVSSFSGSSALVTLTLTGTTEQFEESVPNYWVYENGGWHEDDCDNITPPQGGLEGYGTDRNDPVPYGGVAIINGWLTTVVEIVPDETDLFYTTEELGVSPAAAGNILFNVELGFTYDGSDASTVIGEDLALAMVNGSTVYGDESDCASQDEFFLNLQTEVGPGGEVWGYVCREIAAGDVTGMLLRMTDAATGTDYWFDLSGE